MNLYLSTEIQRAFKDKQRGYFEDVACDHGRIEQRKMWVTDEVKWLVDRHPDWKTIQSIITVRSIRDIKGKGNAEELRFYISSKAGVDAQKWLMRLEVIGRLRINYTGNWM